jgi:hypothetical protein
MSENLKKYQYDDILGTLDGAKGFFINASDVGNFDIAMKIIEEEKNRRAQPDNPPLTLKQIKQRIGKPVWVTYRDGSGGRYGIVNSYPTGLCADVESGTAYWFKDYCGTIAYARKPEKDGDEE